MPVFCVKCAFGVGMRETNSRMAAEEELVDRRRDDRFSVMTSVEIDLGGARLSATAMDMSVSGISVWAPDGVKPLGEFTIVLDIDKRGPIELGARVAREYESDGGSVWGLAFTYVPPEIAARIESYLEKL
jgi:c-di-GMP-binding flagellar brake protein YcgR